MKILDCTLRDGGYYNDWNFSKSFVNDYLEASVRSSVDIIEIGFRFTPKDIYLGPFAYTTEDLLNSIEIPKELDIAVMINLKDILETEDQLNTLNKLFVDKEKSKVSIVRVAAHHKDVLNARITCDFLKEKGYIVGLNIMQIESCPTDTLTNIVKELTRWDNSDVLYFADSLGNMREPQIDKVLNILKSIWPKDIGIHTHNNMGQALSNSLYSIKEGITWIDATLSGMGRGAGNTELENLLIETSKINEKYNAAPYMKLLQEFFYPLKKRCSWGSNYFYYLGANKGLHPTYIQQMLKDGNYSADEIYAAILELSDGPAGSFSMNNLNNALTIKFENISPKPVKKLLDTKKSAVIIAPNTNLQIDQFTIDQFIDKRQSFVICLNSTCESITNRADLIACSHPSKLASFVKRNGHTNVNILAPIKIQETNKESIHYSLSLNNDSKIDITESGCTLREPLVGQYAISFLISQGVEEIYLIGFEGYADNDSRQQSMNLFFQNILDQFRSVRIKALTPTKYNIKKGSIYSPWQI